MSLSGCIALTAATSFGPFNRASNKGVKYLCSVALRADEGNISVVRMEDFLLKITHDVIILKNVI